MSTPRTVAFHTLGCKLNFSESSTISKQFATSGYQEVPFTSPSDIYIINTCSVTDEADKKCRKAVRAAMRQNSQAQVVVIGCYAQLKPDEIAAIPGVNMVLGAQEKFNILDHIHKRDLDSPHTLVYKNDISTVRHFEPSYSIDDRTRSFLKIQDGCDYKCSFCTIPLARGASRSGKIQTIIETAKELISKGIKEIVLTGVNIGDFENENSASDTTLKHKSLIHLLEKLDQIDTECRFRISSIEPNLCTNEIINFVSQSKYFMPHFHMPLQSGDNEILKWMRRRYKRELYEDRVWTIKEKMPHACIGTDVITGFPGEQESHFNNTYNFIENLDVSYLHVFSYSERENTEALHLKNPVPTPERHKRSVKLRALSQKKKFLFSKRFEQTDQEILVENKLNEGRLSGFTKNYLRVNIENNTDLINEIIPVKLLKLNDDLTFNCSIRQPQYTQNKNPRLMNM